MNTGNSILFALFTEVVERGFDSDATLLFERMRNSRHVSPDGDVDVTTTNDARCPLPLAAPETITLEWRLQPLSNNSSNCPRKARHYPEVSRPAIPHPCQSVSAQRIGAHRC